MPRKSYAEIASEVGIAYARTGFKDFQDPKMRGPAFQWEHFPDLIAGFASSGLFMCFKRIPGKLERLKVITYAAAKQEAQRLVDAMQEEESRG